MTPARKWILAIVGLLGGNVLATITLATVANVGHSEVIPDYYDQAARFDDKLAQEDANRKLGWTVEVALADGRLSVRARDPGGGPLDGSLVEITGFPRAHAGERWSRVLAPAGPGRYAAPIDRSPGVHDVQVTIVRGRQRFVRTIMVEPQ